MTLPITILTRASYLLNAVTPGDKDKHGRWGLTFCGRVHDRAFRDWRWRLLEALIDAVMLPVDAALRLSDRRLRRAPLGRHCRSCWLADVRRHAPGEFFGSGWK